MGFCPNGNAPQITERWLELWKITMGFSPASHGRLFWKHLIGSTGIPLRVPQKKRRPLR